MNAQIDASRLRILDVFKLIREVGQVSDADMLQTFNCGVGMTIVCPPAGAEAIIDHLAGFKLEAYPIGTIVPGQAVVEYTNEPRWDA
jgi:phosphoribosylaminoimidazole (AIR) synthetase